jgi:hypothetical protein
MDTKDKIEIGIAIINLIIIGLTAFFIYRSISSPLRAVTVGRQLDDEEKKDLIKRNLFFTLFAHRGNPIHQQFVAALNQIDIAFHDNQKVLDLWHRYYEALRIKGQVDEQKVWELHRVELLSEMAKSLGYFQLNQTEIMKHYQPEGQDNWHKLDWDIRESALSYLKRGDELFFLLSEQIKNNQQSQENNEIKSKE